MLQGFLLIMLIILRNILSAQLNISVLLNLISNQCKTTKEAVAILTVAVVLKCYFLSVVVLHALVAV